jgi:hypothetical protein
LRGIGTAAAGIFFEQSFAVLNNEKRSATMLAGLFRRPPDGGRIKRGGSKAGRQDKY